MPEDEERPLVRALPAQCHSPVEVQLALVQGLKFKGKHFQNNLFEILGETFQKSSSPMKLIFGTHQHDGRDDGLRRHRGYLHAVLQDSPGGHPRAVQELVLLHSVLDNL